MFQKLLKDVEKTGEGWKRDNFCWSFEQKQQADVKERFISNLFKWLVSKQKHPQHFCQVEPKAWDLKATEEDADWGASFDHWGWSHAPANSAAWFISRCEA